MQKFFSATAPPESVACAGVILCALRLAFVCTLLVGVAGCGDGSATRTPATGEFGPLNAAPATHVPPAKPPPSVEDTGTPVLTCLQTELSPAVLLHTGEREISLFTGLEQFDRSPPGHVAFSTRNGPRPFKTGDRLDPSQMEENWLMAWFAGTRGWTNGDVPWAIYLQHRPDRMRLDSHGLHLRFPKTAGYIAMLPIYGIYLCPTATNSNPLEFDGKKVQVWQWAEVLPREPLMRVRYWAGALRQFPQYCEETFSVDRSTDTLTLRQKMTWIAIDDDWKTKSVFLNPINPQLALASRDENFPLKLDTRIMDFEMPTTAGPFMAAQSEDPVHASLRILRHVNAGSRRTTTNASTVKARGSWAHWEPAAEERERCIDLAHVAYRTGEIDRYHYACYLFARAYTRAEADRAFPEYADTFKAKRRPGVAALPTNSPPRLIPAARPSPFVLGIERDVSGPNARLLQHIEAADGAWPSLVILGKSTNLNFGRIRVADVPGRVVRQYHSHNTERIQVFRP